FFYSLRIPCRTWLLFFSLPRSRPGSTLFPYTTLFRSGLTCLRLLCVELLHLCLDRACLLRIAVHLTKERQVPLRRSFRHGSLKQETVPYNAAAGGFVAHGLSVRRDEMPGRVAKLDPRRSLQC